MSKWARVDKSIVAEITDIDPEGRFHPSLQWVAFDGRKNIKVGDIYTDGEFSGPEPEPTPEGARWTFKTDVWKRMTDEEAELLDVSLNAASVKHRRIWEDSLSIEHDSEFFSLLRDEMAAAFGEQRADEILAESSR